MTQENTPLENWLPLNLTSYYILLALFEGDLHGYGIMQQIAEERKVKLGSTTLYRSIKNLQDDKLIEESEKKFDIDTNGLPRRYYHITALGRQVVNAEHQRINELAQYSEKKLKGSFGKWNPSRG